MCPGTPARPATPLPSAMTSSADKLRFLLQEVESERLVMNMSSTSTSSSLHRSDSTAAQQRQHNAQAVAMARAHGRPHETPALDMEEKLSDNIPGLGVFLFRKDIYNNKRPQDFNHMNSVQKNAIVKVAYSIIEQVCGRICPGQEADLLDSISRIHQTYYRHRAVTLKNAAATAAMHQHARSGMPPPLPTTHTAQPQPQPQPTTGSWLGDGAYEMKDKGGHMMGPSIGTLRAAAELMEGFPLKPPAPAAPAMGPVGPVGGYPYPNPHEQVGSSRRPPPPDADMQRSYKRRTPDTQQAHQVHEVGGRPPMNMAHAHKRQQAYGPGRSFMASPLAAPAHSSMTQSMGSSMSLPPHAPTPQEALLLNKLWQARGEQAGATGGRGSALLAAASLLNDTPTQQPASSSNQPDSALSRPPIVTVEI